YFDVRRFASVFQAEPADEGAGVAARSTPDAEMRIKRGIANDPPQVGGNGRSRRGLAAGKVFGHARIAVETQEIRQIIEHEFAQFKTQRLQPGRARLRRDGETLMLHPRPALRAAPIGTPVPTSVSARTNRRP